MHICVCRANGRLATRPHVMCTIVCADGSHGPRAPLPPPPASHDSHPATTTPPPPQPSPACTGSRATAAGWPGRACGTAPAAGRGSGWDGGGEVGYGVDGCGLCWGEADGQDEAVGVGSMLLAAAAATRVVRARQHRAQIMRRAACAAQGSSAAARPGGAPALAARRRRWRRRGWGTAQTGPKSPCAPGSRQREQGQAPA